MSEARSAIAALAAQIAAIGRPALPEPSATRRLLERLGAIEAAPKAPEASYLEALRARLRQAFPGGSG